MKRLTSLFRIIKGKTNMNTQVEDKKLQIYVWTKTEKAGSIVRVAEDQKDKKWLYFDNGTRINPSLIKEYLIKAGTEEEAKGLAASFGNSLGVGVKTNIEPKIVEPSAPKVANTTTTEQVAEVNVMMEMLKKMSKKNKAEMPVQVNIPSSIVYEMLQDQMDLEAEDLNEQIGLLIENQINNLQDQLRSQIKSFITKYYENE